MAVEAALLFEWRPQRYFDETWVVVTGPRQQVRRCMKRDSVNHSEALAAINSQWPQERKVKRSTRVLRNTRDVDYLMRQVRHGLTLALNSPQRRPRTIRGAAA